MRQQPNDNYNPKGHLGIRKRFRRQVNRDACIT